jgi:tRNA (uracil-5-)-methyltransferase TRM9
VDFETRQRLNGINQRFYQTTAVEFDQTRGEAWRGWEMLLPHLPKIKSVLDVGCGNGRFGLYLAEKHGADFRYHGIDNNQTLLDFAAQSLKGKLPDVHLENRDLLEGLSLTDSYDLIVLFGVIHHIPGYRERQAFIRSLAEKVTSGGLLVFASWRFYEFERFRERIVAWDDDLGAKVERHDYLLDWRRGEVALRYCHYVDDDEQTALIRGSGLREILTYRADGSTGMTNCYSILSRD